MWLIIKELQLLKSEEVMCDAWTRIEEPTRHSIGLLRDEREEEDRGRTGQRSL